MTSSRTVGVLAALLAVATALVAGQTAVTGEVAVAQFLNRLPKTVIDAFSVLSRLGEREAIVVIAIATAVVAGKRAVRVGLVVLAAGALAWAAAMIVKDNVERPRPLELGADVVAYDDVSTPGWPSAQTTIATAALASAALAMGRRPGPALVAGTGVGLSRVVLGVSLPLDAIGGVAVGITIAVLVVELSEAAPRKVSAGASATA